MIAALPMYDWPQVATATDALWALIRDQLRGAGIDAPEHLTRGRDLWDIWQDRDLLLAQTCGMPYRTRLHGHVQLVGTPDYGLPGAPPGHYYSQIRARRDDARDFTGFRDGVLAYNDAASQSGWAAPQNQAAAQGFRFDYTLPTGAHVDSARAVADGRADLAAIDAVTWRLIEAHEPGLAASLRLVGHTDPTPGLPLITAPGRDADALFRAVTQAIAALGREQRAMLGIAGLTRLPDRAYLAVPTPAPPGPADGRPDGD